MKRKTPSALRNLFPLSEEENFHFEPLVVFERHTFSKFQSFVECPHCKERLNIPPKKRADIVGQGYQAQCYKCKRVFLL